MTDEPLLADPQDEKLEPLSSPCDVILKPMAEWVVEEDPKGVCRDCLLGPVVQWYGDELKEKGEPEKAEQLTKVVEAPDVIPLTVCQELDNIKGTVGEELRERFLEFDCAAQSYTGEDDEEEEI